MSILDADELIAQAMAETGLSDFGDDTLPERFGVLIGKFREAGMDAAGERIAAEVALGLFRQRLEVFEDRRRYPIADEVIDAPIFASEALLDEVAVEVPEGEGEGDEEAILDEFRDFQGSRFPCTSAG